MNKALMAAFGRGTIGFPPELFPLEGFCGIHDEPHVRVMALKTPEDAFALLTLELVICPEDMIGPLREQIGSELGIPAQKVWIHVNHTITTPHEPGHRGPKSRGGELTEEERRKRGLYREAVETAISDAVMEARDGFFPARLGWGSAQCAVNKNRDVETPFGWWVGRAGDGPSNHRLELLRIDGPDGGMRGLMLFYALKPCAVDNSGMRSGTRLVSSDVTGEARRLLEDRTGAATLFCMTAAGDQVPVKQALYDTVGPDGQVLQTDEGPEKGLEYVSELGRILAEDVAVSAEKIVCSKDAPTMCWTRAQFNWPTRRHTGRGLTKRLENTPGGEAAVTAEIFRLDDAVLLAAKPEINFQTERELMERSPFGRTVLITMVNGDMKYMPEEGAYERATMEAQSAFFMPGAAERFVEETAKALDTLKGDKQR